MNQITDALLRQLVPKLSLIVFSDGFNKFYIESYPIDENGRLQAGKPLEHETMQRIAQYFSTEEKKAVYSDGIFPNNILHLDERKNCLIWFRQSEKRQMYFSKDLKIKDGVAQVPALIYKVSERTLSVFAYNHSDKLDEDLKLYQAPFHNVNSQGGVCLGSASIKMSKTPSIQKIMKYWEDKFWLSVFTHISADNPAKTNINFLWSEQIKTGKEFSFKQLLETKQTLKSIIK